MKCLQGVVVALALLGVGGWAVTPAGADDEKLRLDPASLPWHTTVVKVLELTPAQVEEIAKRLGASLSRVTNEVVALAGMEAQVNLIECPTEAEAERLYATMASAKKHTPGGGLGRRARVVVEVTAASSTLVAKRLLASAAALLPGTRTYRASLRLGCVDEVDQELANELWILVRAGHTPDTAQVQSLVKTWKLGTSLALWTGTRPYYEASFALTPAPVSSETVGDVTRFHFEKLPALVGIPYVDVKARITVRNAYAPAGGERPDASLTAATPAWPSAAEDVKALAKDLTSSCKTDLERVVAIQAHVHASIAQKGPPGTRYGVEKVLQQRFGNCWDKSDALVTLCRAAGVPAREIAGWVPILGGGHVWAEVYVEGGWLPIDSTAPWLGVSDDYVPWFSTSDGHMPIVHLANPLIQRDE